MVCLLEIPGKWKLAGADIKRTYSSSAWTVGSAKLIQTRSSGLRWHLDAQKNKTLSRHHANPKEDRVVWTETSNKCNRISVTTAKGTFYIIPYDQTAQYIKDLSDKTSRTLGMLSKSSKSYAGDEEKMSIDDAVEAILFDENGGDDDDALAESASHSSVRVKDLKKAPPSDLVKAPPSDLDSQDTWILQDLQKTPDNSKESSASSKSEPGKSFYGKSSSSYHGFPKSRTVSKPSGGGGILLSSIVTPQPLLSSNSTQENIEVKIKPKGLFSKKLVLPMYEKKFHIDGVEINSDSDDETLLKLPLLGFKNLGNTCYMNVVLQSLFSLDIFVGELLHCYKKFRSSLEERSLLRCLTKLAACKKDVKMKVSEQNDLLRRLSKAVANKTDKYSALKQHDAHEYFCEILDILKEEIISMQKERSEDTSVVATSPAASVTSDTVAAATPPQAQANINPAVDNFEFEVLTTLKCTGCTRETKISGTQNGLTVSIPEVYLQGTSPSLQKTRLDTYLQDTLDCYFQSETVDYLCENCGASTALSLQSFSRLPRVLVVVVKRFQNQGVTSKIEQKIEINKYIALAKHCESHVPLASAPTIPIKLWAAPDFSKKERTSAEGSAVRKSSNSGSWSEGGGVHSTPTKSSAQKRLMLEPSQEKIKKLHPPTTHPQISADDEPSASSIFTTVGAPKSSSGLYKFKAINMYKTCLDKTFTSKNSNSDNSYGKPKEKSSSQSTLDEDHSFFTIEDGNGDMDMAIDLSKQQEATVTKRSKDYMLDALTEEEQYNLAVKQSLKDVNLSGGVGKLASPLRETVEPGQIRSNGANVHRKTGSQWIRPSSVEPSGLSGGNPNCLTVNEQISYLLDCSSSDDDDDRAILSMSSDTLARETTTNDQTPSPCSEEDCRPARQSPSSSSSEQNLTAYCWSSGLRGGNPVVLTSNDTPPPKLKRSPLVSRNDMDLVSSKPAKRPPSRSVSPRTPAASRTPTATPTLTSHRTPTYVHDKFKANVRKAIRREDIISSDEGEDANGFNETPSKAKRIRKRIGTPAEIDNINPRKPNHGTPRKPNHGTPRKPNHGTPRSQNHATPRKLTNATPEKLTNGDHRKSNDSSLRKANTAIPRPQKRDLHFFREEDEQPLKQNGDNSIQASHSAMSITEEIVLIEDSENSSSEFDSKINDSQNRDSVNHSNSCHDNKSSSTASVVTYIKMDSKAEQVKVSGHLSADSEDFIFSDVDEEDWRSPKKLINTSPAHRSPPGHGSPPDPISPPDHRSPPDHTYPPDHRSPSEQRPLPAKRTLSPQTADLLCTSETESVNSPGSTEKVLCVKDAQEVTSSVQEEKVKSVAKECAVSSKASSSSHPDKENLVPLSIIDSPTSNAASSSESNQSKLYRTLGQTKAMRKHEQTGTEFGYSYKLVGVVSHVGSTSSCGHYINDVYNVERDTWLSYNDAVVSSIELDSVCSRRQRSGYIFLYMDSMVLEDIKNM